jgi:hypothetical protein
MRFPNEYPKKTEWWFYIGTLYLIYTRDKYVTIEFNGINLNTEERGIYYKVPKNWFSGKGGANNVERRVSIDHCTAVVLRI